MFYVLTLLIGLVLGGICMFLVIMDKHRRIRAKAMEVSNEAAQMRTAIEAKRQQLLQYEAGLKSRVHKWEAVLNQRSAEMKTKQADAEKELGRRAFEMKSRQTEAEKELDRRAAEMYAKEHDLEHRVITCKQLEDENAILKQDLRNLDMDLQKLKLDEQLRGERQEQIDRKATDLANRYLNETVKSVVDTVGPSNFTACKDRMLGVIIRCRDIGFNISADQEDKMVATLKVEFEKAVKAAFEREEQTRIKSQIREEEKLNREVDRELRQLERERLAIQAALDQALKEAKDQHSAEVDRLQARLAEAEAKSQRALSLAQQTKAGNVYVISNIGSFGEGVYKVGMTRRLEPLDRVRELGDASVPFPFDVHMMISCQDAPSLENALHRELHKLRLNKINPRKEFFRTDIETICRIVREHHGEVQYVANSEALEYRQSTSMTEDDSEYIEAVYNKLEDKSEIAAEDLT